MICVSAPGKGMKRTGNSNVKMSDPTTRLQGEKVSEDQGRAAKGAESDAN